MRWSSTKNKCSQCDDGWVLVQGDGWPCEHCAEGQRIKFEEQDWIEEEMNDAKGG
jgi:hypothetical protein